MKRNRKFLQRATFALLTVSLLAGLAACSGTGAAGTTAGTTAAKSSQSSSDTAAGTEHPDTWIADRHLTGQMFVGDASGSLPTDQIGNKVAQKIKDLTGMTIEWTYAAGNDDLEIMSQTFMTGEMPDVIVSYLDDSSRPEWPVLKQAADQGMFANIAPHLAETEVYSQYLDPAYLPIDSYRNILFNEDFDGAAYFLHLSVPRYAGSAGSGYHQLHMNMDVSEAIGVKPEDIQSTEDLYEASQKILDAKLTDRNDAPVVPIGPTVWGGRLQYELVKSAAFNYNRDSVFNLYDGQVKHVANTPLIEEQVMLIREGVANKYMDPETFTMNSNTATERFLNGNHGFMYMSTWQANDKYFKTGTEWLPVSHMTDANGDSSIHAKEKSGWLVWAINANAENPEEILQFADFLATKEGKEIVQYGIEGEDFTRDENGQPVIKQEILDRAAADTQAAIDEYNSMAVGSFWGRIGHTDNAPMDDFGEWNIGDKLNVENAAHTQFVATYSNPDITWYDGAPAKSYLKQMPENIQMNLGQLLESQYHEDMLVRAAISAESDEDALKTLEEYRNLLANNGIAEFEAKLQDIYETAPETIYFD